MSTVKIETKYGKVSGIVRGGHREWRGIPYAKAPTGELRFKHAVECEPWEGTLDASDFGCRSVQFQQGDTTTTKWKESEDSLFLNIWSPMEAEKAPVFVYMHGGGWLSGEGSSPTYSCEGFVKDGIVGVNLNYRLGCLGFVNFDEYDSSFECNCGISDQIMALKWIKENIAAFGGDPDNITIAGQSAGAGNVLAVMTSPAAKGLANRGIAMSVIYKGTCSREFHRSFAADFLDYLKIDKSDISSLRSLPVEKLIEAHQYAQSKNALISWMIGDSLIPVDPADALKAGAAKEQTLMLGVCHQEMALFHGFGMQPETYAMAEAFLRSFGKEDQMERLKEIYPDESRLNMIYMATDLGFVNDTVGAAVSQSQYGKTYLYRYDHEITPVERGLGAAHGAEIELALDTDSPYESKMCDPDDLAAKWDERVALGKEMHTAFANFAKCGDPNGGFEAEWPAFDAEKMMTMCVNKVSHAESNPFGEGFRFWHEIIG